MGASQHRSSHGYRGDRRSPEGNRRSRSPDDRRRGGYEDRRRGGYEDRRRGDERLESGRDERPSRDYSNARDAHRESERNRDWDAPARSRYIDDRRNDRSDDRDPDRRIQRDRAHLREVDDGRKPARDRIDSKDERGGRDYERPATTGRQAADAKGSKAGPQVEPADGTAEETGEEGMLSQDPEEAMMAAMGFGGFGSTKGSKVAGNVTGSANVKKERTWRQYMNRKGGFNRQLDPVNK
ncbi:unnamed protein product [Parajaminaea phylloscopi]